MVTQTQWTNLQFNFDAPAGKYPALVERLAGTPVRLSEKLLNISIMILPQPYNNGWSIQEHAGHLTDLEYLLQQRLDDYENNATVLTAADMTNKKTYEANYNDVDVKTILKNFKTARQQTLERLNSYNEDMVLRSAQHPRLNTPMRLIDLVHFFAEHDDHHLATISNIEKLLA